MSEDIFSFRYFTFDPARPECAGFYSRVVAYEEHSDRLRALVHAVADKLGIDMGTKDDPKDWSYSVLCKDGVGDTPIIGVVFNAHSAGDFSAITEKFGRDAIIKNTSRRWADDGRVVSCRFRKKSPPQILCAETAERMGVKGTTKQLLEFVGGGINWFFHRPGMRTLPGEGRLSQKRFLIHCDKDWREWIEWFLANGATEVDAAEASRLVNEAKAEVQKA